MRKRIKLNNLVYLFTILKLKIYWLLSLFICTPECNVVTSEYPFPTEERCIIVGEIVKGMEIRKGTKYLCFDEKDNYCFIFTPKVEIECNGS